MKILTIMVLIGTASWYGPGFIGNRTASGTIYTGRDMTVAHKTLPFGTCLYVKNDDNGNEAVVKVTDRGPYIENRILDFSEAAAEKLGMKESGTCNVTAVRIPCLEG